MQITLHITPAQLTAIAKVLNQEAAGIGYDGELGDIRDQVLTDIVLRSWLQNRNSHTDAVVARARRQFNLSRRPVAPKSDEGGSPAKAGRSLRDRRTPRHAGLPSTVRVVRVVRG